MRRFSQREFGLFQSITAKSNLMRALTPHRGRDAILLLTIKRIEESDLLAKMFDNWRRDQLTTNNSGSSYEVKMRYQLVGCTANSD